MKKLLLVGIILGTIFSLIHVSYAVTSFEKNEWNTAPDVTIIDPKDVNLEQYTPDQAKWGSFETKPFASGTNTSHDPDGVGWLSPESWVAAAWDGTVYNPSEMSKSELQDAICPKGDQIRGLRNDFGVDIQDHGFIEKSFDLVSGIQT